MLRLPTIPSGPDLWRWPPFAAGLLIVAVLLGVSATRIGIRAVIIHRERQAMDQRIGVLEAKRAKLRQTIQALGTPEAVERLAKERLNLKQAGEEVVIVTPASPPAPPFEPSRLLGLAPLWLRELVTFLKR